MAVVKFNKRSHRLIASIYPPVGIFDGFGNPEDAKAAMELESQTNDRLTGALGRLAAIPKEDWTTGAAGSHMAMAAFLHPSAGRKRFHRDSLLAWYAALTIETAIRESLYHHTSRLAASDANYPCPIQMRELLSAPDAFLEDLTSEQTNRSELYHQSDYSNSQAFGEEVRKSKSDGIIYNSVRHTGGTNIVIFRPRLLVPVIQGDHYQYTWDESGQPDVRKLTSISL